MPVYRKVEAGKIAALPRPGEEGDAASPIIGRAT